MKKRLLRTISVLLCLSILCSVSAYAAEARASSQINIASAKLTTKSNGDLSLLCYITANGTMDTIGVSKVVIQRYSSTNWVTEYTFTAQTTPSLQTSNASSHIFALTYTPKYIENSYRAVVSFCAKSSSITSTVSVTTNTVP